jgi:hypothetical protein
VEYVVFDHRARLCEVEHFDNRTGAMPGSAKEAAGTNGGGPVI